MESLTGKVRWVTLGMLPNGTIVVMVHTFRGKNTDPVEYRGVY
jgi:uncharacterized DUF497 family protein